MNWITRGPWKHLWTPLVTTGFTLIVATFISPANGNEVLRPKSRELYDRATVQRHFRLPNARVAWVDFERMRADFPELQSLSDGAIEDWILDQFAYISELQLRLRGIRVSEFPIDEKNVREFIHPTSYRRASIAEATFNGHSLGLVDLKGTGHSADYSVDSMVTAFRNALNDAERDKIRLRDHSDGVASLGEGIAEVAKQTTVQAAFDVRGRAAETVESYFLIDTGFDILKAGGESIPASIIGRQAHLRGAKGPAGAENIYEDEHGGFQRSVTGASVDFGGVVVVDPEAKELYGPIPGGTSKDPQHSKAWAFGHDVGREFRIRSAQDIFGARKKVYDHLQTMKGGLAALWPPLRWKKPQMSSFDFWKLAIRIPSLKKYIEMEKPGGDPEFRRAFLERIRTPRDFSEVHFAEAFGITDPEFFRIAYVDIGLPAFRRGQLLPGALLRSGSLRRATFPSDSRTHQDLVALYLSTDGGDEVLEVLKGRAITRDPLVLQALMNGLSAPHRGYGRAVRLVTSLGLQDAAIVQRLEEIAKVEVDTPLFAMISRALEPVQDAASEAVQMARCRSHLRARPIQ